MASIPSTKDDLRAALPDTSTPLRLTGLQGQVKIYRDAYGIPHVKAKTVGDAFFGQGFATAQDRLWHMDYDRRRAYGRWAEYAGESAVEDDLLMRRFQLLPSVKLDYDGVNEETTEMLDAYAAGVNAFIETTEALPAEYAMVGGEPEPWRPWDCLAVYKVRHVLMGGFDGKLWRARLVNELGAERASQMLPGHKSGELLILPPGSVQESDAPSPVAVISAAAEHLRWLGDTEAGSNSWAVHGSRTTSGKPLLAGDPHRALDTPNVYYQNHIACDEFDAVGLSFPGFPGFLHFGHNASVAWCVTHAVADYQDLYIERFKPGDPPTYESKGEWLRGDVRHEVVNVRDTGPVKLDVVVTQHGPIVVGDPSSGFAAAFKYASTAGPNMGFQCIRRMLRSTSVAEHDESMREWVDPGNNFVFADVHGDIGYVTRGKVPVRSAANAWLPVPGWTGEHEWNGSVPFEEMPRSRNPETGYIVTANNRIIDDVYPHYIGLFFGTDYRARRITERLKGLTDATVEDMASVHAERVSIPARTYLALMADVEPTDDLSAKAKERLLAWDGAMDRDDVAPLIYSAMRQELDRMSLRHLLGDALADEALSAAGRGAPFHASHLKSCLVAKASARDSSWLPDGITWPSMISQALEDGVAYLRSRLGDDIDSWTWGALHRTRPRHTLSEVFPESAPLLDPPSFSMAGDGDTPQQSGYSPGAPFDMTSMAVARYVFDTSDWSNSRWVVPLGASGHPGSPHYADQAPIWAEVELIPMLYDWGQVAQTAEGKQTLAVE